MCMLNHGRMMVIRIGSITEDLQNSKGSVQALPFPLSHLRSITSSQRPGTWDASSMHILDFAYD